MPNIREAKSAGSEGISSEGFQRGANAMIDLGNFQQRTQEDIGRRIGGAVAHIGGAIESFQNDKQQAQTELMQGAAALATMRVNIDDQWGEYVRRSDPGDPNLRTKFWNETVQPQIEKFMSGFTTDDSRAWAAKAIAGYTESAQTSFAGDVANLSAHNLELNLQTTINQNTQSINRSPATLPEQLSGLKDFLHAAVVTSQIDPKKVGEVEGELYQKYAKQYVDAAMSGIITRDPVAALNYLQSGGPTKDFGQFVDQGDIDGWMKQAETAQKANVVARNEAQERFNKEKDRMSKAQRYNYQTEAYDATDGKWHLTPDLRQRILDDPNMKPEDKQDALAWLTEHSNKDSASDDTPGLVQELVTGIQNGSIDKNGLLKFVDAGGDRHIKQSTFNWLMNLTDGTQEQKDFMKNNVTAEIDRVGSIIAPKNPLTGQFTAAADEQAYNEMKADVYNKLMSAKDLNEQKDMLNPASKNYIFNPDYIKAWQQRHEQLRKTGRGQGALDQLLVPGSTGLAPPAQTPPAATPTLPPLQAPFTLPPRDQQGALEGGIVQPASFNPTDLSFMSQAGQQLQGIVAAHVADEPVPNADVIPAVENEQQLLNVIARGEAPGGYNQRFGEPNNAPQYNLTSMSLDDVIALPANTAGGYTSTASGRYQFLSKTLRSLKSELGLTGKEIFTPALQDKLAAALLVRRGLVEYLAGDITDRQFAKRLSKEWASLPNPATGHSYYGQGTAHSVDAILASINKLYKAA